MQYRDFESARKFVQSLGLKSKTEWSVYAKSPHKPNDIPSSPQNTYKKQWKGWGDWLGTGRIATFNMQFRDFESARRFVRSLGLKRQTEWNVYAKSPHKPSNIPSNPNKVYKKQWKGWGDWLGTGNVRTKQFRDFESARKFVHSLGLKSQTEWSVYAKSLQKPNDIPYSPNEVYKKQWKGMGDWLGTGRIATFNMQFRDFESARRFVRSLGLKSQTEWKKYIKSGTKPNDIPSNPNQVYKKQWKGWGDWLGTGNVRTKQFRDFESARKFVHSLGLKNNTEWRKYAKSLQKPNDIPYSPEHTYKKQWKGYGDWLGTGNVHTKQFRDFESARKFVHSLGLKSVTEWSVYAKSPHKPNDIPSNPNKVYKKQWKGVGDWLGTGRIADKYKQFRDFESARKFVQSLSLKNREEWNVYAKSPLKPADIPSNPNKVYKKQWKGVGDWLGTGRIATFNMQYRDFESARRFVRSLGLKSQTEWRKYIKSGTKPNDIPSAPNQVYKKQWKGVGDWLGTGNVHTKQFRDFESARKFVRKLGLKNFDEWREFCKSPHKPADIPYAPRNTYKKQWKGMGDWLGTGNVSALEISKNYLPFKEAREQVRALAKKYNLKNWEDYKNAVKKGLIPKNIPANPRRVYSKKRKRNAKKENNLV